MSLVKKTAGEADGLPTVSASDISVSRPAAPVAMAAFPLTLLPVDLGGHHCGHLMGARRVRDAIHTPQGMGVACSIVAHTQGACLLGRSFYARAQRPRA